MCEATDAPLKSSERGSFGLGEQKMKRDESTLFCCVIQICV
jgi:hypothetical protein